MFEWLHDTERCVSAANWKFTDLLQKLNEVSIHRYFILDAMKGN